MAGDSPGYSLSLVAETTTGVLLSVERTACARLGTPANTAVNNGTSGDGANNWVSQASGSSGAGNQFGSGLGGPELPEDVGREGAMMLLQEIYKGELDPVFGMSSVYFPHYNKESYL